jgi:hypothetical protein
VDHSRNTEGTNSSTTSSRPRSLHIRPADDIRGNAGRYCIATGTVFTPTCWIPGRSWAARVRLLSTGHGRKSDAADATSVGIAALTATRLYRSVPLGCGVCLLHRHRSDRGVLRRRHPPPAFPRRQSPAQPLPAHHGHYPTQPRHPRPSLLPEQTRRGQKPSRGAALSKTATVRRCLPPPGTRCPP